MDDVVVFIPLLIVAVALVFWGAMFRDLWANPDLPVSSASGIAWPPSSKNAWTFYFVVFTVIGAVLYYLAVGRDRR